MAAFRPTWASAADVADAGMVRSCRAGPMATGDRTYLLAHTYEADRHHCRRRNRRVAWLSAARTRAGRCIHGGERSELGGVRGPASGPLGRPDGRGQAR